MQEIKSRASISMVRQRANNCTAENDSITK